MAFATPLAAAEEIHAHLVDELNLALRRPGTHGGETAFRMLVDHLLFVEREPEAWDRLRRDWDDRGLWTPIGIGGAFRDVFPPARGCLRDRFCVRGVRASARLAQG
ncbi:hypothetical protein ABZ401_07615 [Streptomyces sp. NPDC005892]|uniref:hypothetical protein n=1 Tax=Streptomyces sp. NPDC005892 TaxID=3155593 RepID=UPI0033F19261